MSEISVSKIGLFGTGSPPTGGSIRGGQVKLKQVKFNKEQCKLALAATELDAFVRGRLSKRKTLIRAFGTLLCVRGVNND